MGDLKVLKTNPAQRRREQLLELVSQLRSRIEANNVEGLLVIEHSSTCYSYTRIGFSFEEAIGMHDRAKYDLHVVWDKANREQG